MMEALDGRSSLLFQLLRYAAGWGLLPELGGLKKEGKGVVVFPINEHI